MSDPQTDALKKPVRPLTSYHLFFQLEREFILQSIQSPNNDENEPNEGRQLGKDLDTEMPARYQNIKLSPTWYASASGKRTKTKESDIKRKHRKSHGKISFLELSQQVASRWKTLDQTDNETKMYCTKIAELELQSYKEKVKQYKANVAAREELYALESITGSFTSIGSSSSCLNSSGASSVAQQSNSSTMYQLSSSAKKSPGAPLMSMSDSSSTKGSSKFLPQSMKKRNLNNFTRNSGIQSTLPLSETKRNDEIDRKREFSFFPLPPSLQEREDIFLENCRKRAKISSSLGQYLQRPLSGANNEMTEMAEINDVIFDSTMSDLSPRASFLMETDQKKGSRKRSSSILSDGDISPLQCCEALAPMEYKFTSDDAEFLLKALF